MNFVANCGGNRLDCYALYFNHGCINQPSNDIVREQIITSEEGISCTQKDLISRSCLWQLPCVKIEVLLSKCKKKESENFTLPNFALLKIYSIRAKYNFKRVISLKKDEIHLKSDHCRHS